MHPDIPPPPNPGGTGRPPLVAVTGATGFIGQHLVPALAQAGWQTRLLLRRDPDVAAWRQVRPQVVAGALHDPAALDALVDGADAVIHVAGLIKAARRAHFFEVNRDGAETLARTVKRLAPQAHFLHVSSLAAREPSLSDYAASKRAGEQAVLDVLGPQATVLRPPAVYGPGDRETLLFFQLARGRRVPLLGPPEGRAALIDVRDLVALIVALVAAKPQGAVVTAADDRPQGYSWGEVLGAAARAVGNGSPRFMQVPRALLGSVAKVGDVGRLFGSASMLSSQKLRELYHPDWAVSAAELPQVAGWSPRFGIDAGFADAVAWYRQAGWLPA